MQSHNENGKQPAAQEPDLSTQPELSAAWRALLGLQSTPPAEDGQEIDPAAPVLPPASDPWNALVHAQGMETIDLQKVHLHTLLPAGSDDKEVEQALDIIQEAQVQAPQEKKAGEA